MVGGPPGVELHTVVDELPSEGAGDMVPVVLPTKGVGMVPNGVADIVAVDDIVVDAVPGTVDDGGTAVAAMEGEGRAGMAGGTCAGMVEPGTSDKNDVAGCADSVSNGAAVLLVVDVEED